MPENDICEVCEGKGIVIYSLEEGGYKWLICRPCLGRGYDRFMFQTWEQPPLRLWHRAASQEALQLVSLIVRIGAPEHPDRMMLEYEDQLFLHQKKVVRLREEKTKLQKKIIERYMDRK